VREPVGAGVRERVAADADGVSDEDGELEPLAVTEPVSVSETGVDVAVAVDVGVGEGRARDAPAPAACKRLTSSALSARVWMATSRMYPIAGSDDP